MHCYIDRKEPNVVVINSTFWNEEDLQYCFNHNFDRIVYTEPRSSNFIDLIQILYKNGYRLENVISRNIMYQNTKLELTPFVYFIKNKTIEI